MYDAPYRLEQSHYTTEGKPVWEIWRTGEGRICEGTNFTDMRNLVDRANEAQLVEQGVSGR